LLLPEIESGSSVVVILERDKKNHCRDFLWKLHGPIPQNEKVLFVLRHFVSRQLGANQMEN
jgi:hypothetical protein